MTAASKTCAADPLRQALDAVQKIGGGSNAAPTRRMSRLMKASPSARSSR